MSRTWKMTFVFLAATGLTAWGLIGCSDDDAATDGGTDSGTDTDADTDTDTDTDADGSLEVLVLSESWTADPAPAEGALVTLDKPGGERVELTTGADGTVAFDGIDWALGTASATASMDGHGMATRVGLTADGGPVTLRIPVLPVETVTLSGTLTNMTDEANWMATEAVVPGGGFYNATGSDYSIEVPTGVPFPLSAIEWLWDPPPSGQGQGFFVQNWYWQEMDAITADTTYDITFTGDVETTEVSGSFDYSLSDGSPLSGTAGRGSVFADVTWDSYKRWTMAAGGWWYYPVGLSVNDINADGTAFDFTIEYIEPSSIEHFVTYYVIESGTGAPFPKSTVIEDGLPTAGSHAIDFVDIPVVPSSSPSAPIELNGVPLTWESAETDVYPELIVVVGDYTWFIEGPVGATSLSVPAPPEGAALTFDIENLLYYGGVLTLTRDAAASTPELWLGAMSFSEELYVKYTP